MYIYVICYTRVEMFVNICGGVVYSMLPIFAPIEACLHAVCRETVTCGSGLTTGLESGVTTAAATTRR